MQCDFVKKYDEEVENEGVAVENRLKLKRFVVINWQKAIHAINQN